MTSSHDRKAALREEALARRDALDPVWRDDASRAMAALARELPELASARIVSGFWPIRSEIDPRPLMNILAARGTGLALPVVQHPTMIFRRWRPGELLERRGFGVSEPADGAEEVAPDLLLVPLACFDRSGGRIGYGKGHYDRALAALKARGAGLAVGVGFSVQEQDTIPTLAHDVPLDMVLTEREIIRPRPGR